MPERYLRLKKRIQNSRVSKSSLQSLPFWIASVLVGLFAVAYAWVFKFLESLSQSFVLVHSWVIFILAPPLFLLSWYLVKKFSEPAAGSGIPQLMAAIELANPKEDKEVDHLLSIKVIVVKFFSSIILVLGGGVIGREGPTIHIAGSLFRIVSKNLPFSWPRVSKRIMLLTGGAAGLAAAFNTPLGGLVFVMEELTKTHITFFRTAVFTSVIIAGITAQAILGPYLYLGYPDVSNPGISILPLILIASILSGIAGAGTSKLILLLNAYKKKKFNGNNQWIFVLGCGILFSVLVYFTGVQSMGSGKDIMENLLFHGAKIPWLLLPFRIAGIVISYCTGAAGGVFSTSLSAGATLGATIAQFFNLNTGTSNLIILTSMIGFLTGVTRTPFTSAVLVLEMTNRNAAIFYFLFAAMIASICAMIIDRHSLYEHVKMDYLRKARHRNEAA